MIYNFRYEIVATIITIIILIFYARSRMIKTNAIKMFMIMAVNVFISSFMDIFVIYMEQNPKAFSYTTLMLFNTLYQLFFHSLGYLHFLLLYIVSNNNKFPRKGIFLITSIPYIISLLFDFTNIFTGFIFYFDENLQYFQGPHISYMYIQAWFYVLLGIQRIFTYKNSITREDKFIISFYTILSITCVTIQWAYPNVLIMGFVISIAVLLVFLYLENPLDYYDKGISIFNRTAFINICGNLLSKKKRFKVIGIKFEEMKYLNDTIGYENRIMLMEEISNSLFKIFGKSKVFRLSRSKMAVILNNEKSKSEKQIEFLRNRLMQPFEFSNLKLSLTAFLDCVNCPEDANNIDDVFDLIENSFDDQVSSDKIYISEAKKDILEVKKRESKILIILNKAIENNDFDIVYQPIYSLKERKYKSAEALLRLKANDLGVISPSEFIPIAEKNGLILKIGKYVFKEVCKFISRNKIWEKGIEYVHINISAIQCIQEKLHEQLLEIMDFYELNHNFINLDVTETSTNFGKESFKRNMDMLIQKSVSFSLDDYGIGLTNTASLVEYKFDSIKIDKSLIWTATEDEKARVILERLVGMTKELGMKIIAEGVETNSQVELVKKLGCDFIQGYYFSKPLNKEEFIKVLI